jgi:hypothetical protein
MNWRPLLLALCLVSVCRTVAAADASLDACFKASEPVRGTHCNKAESIEVNFRNECAQPLDAMYCLQKPDDKWDCSSKRNVKPSETVNHWACRGTGKSRVWGRPLGSNVPFLNAAESIRKEGEQVYVLAFGETQEEACRRAKDVGQVETGGCDCETAGSKNGIRCRLALSAAPAGIVPRPFAKDEFANTRGTPGHAGELEPFTVMAMGDTQEDACSQARSMINYPNGRCECTPRSKRFSCSVTKLMPPNDGTISKLKGKLRKAMDVPAPKPCKTNPDGSPCKIFLKTRTAGDLRG